MTLENNEERHKFLKVTEKKAKKNMIKTMLLLGDPLEDIAKEAGLEISEVKIIIDEINQSS